MTEGIPTTGIKRAGRSEQHSHLAEREVEEVIRWVSARRHVELTLYGAVTLLAAILAFRVSETVRDAEDLLAVVWATALGLAVAHWFAASVAGRLASPKPLPVGHYTRMLWQSYPLLIAACAATVGGVVGIVVGESVQAAARGADIGLTALCAIVAWMGGSANETPYRRRIPLTIFVVVFASVISGAKFVLGH